MSYSFKHYGEAGKAKLKTKHDFDFFKFETIESGVMLLEGCKFKIISRGKNKGDIKWLHEDKQKAVITYQEVGKWCKKYEKETGKCSNCSGEGKIMKSWSAKDVTKHKPCEKCNGTGKPTF